MQIDNRIFWILLALLTLTILFFLTGALLEVEAARHGAKGILKDMKDITSLGQDQLKQIMDFQSQRIAAIHQSASAAYDIAKVSLGAFVSSVAYVLPRSSHQSEN